MTSFTRAAIVTLVFLLAACAPSAQQPAPQQQVQAQQPERPEVFIPIGELPPQDQLPSAPLLITAYSFVALVLFAYVITIARRMTTVQREIDRLESDFKKSGRL